MKIIQLETELPDSDVEALSGTFIDAQHYDQCVRETCRVLKPNGETLLVYLQDAIARPLCQIAFQVFKRVDGVSFNRGTAAGIITEDAAGVPDTSWGDGDVIIHGKQFTPVKGDGTVSRTSYSKPTASGLAGYFDRYPRIPYCRMTAFNLDHYAEFESARPFLIQASRLFEDQMPDRWLAQQDIASHTSPDFVIRDTVFTTITVNRSWRTAVHQDAGDYKPGFGVMSVLEGGSYSGCELIFPTYRCAVDMRTGGLCLADVHEYHGNAPLVGLPGQFVRISLVMYYRQNMIQCGSAAAEQERAKAIGDRISQQHANDAKTLFD